MKGRVLVVAGSDSGGGAGIQADIKAISAMGAYAATALTALTAQNTLGVQEVLEVAPAFVAAQMACVLSDIGADCIKTGMLHREAVINAVADTIEAKAARTPLVVDPVMVAKGGARLLEPAATAALKRRLLVRARIITPNLPEAEVLLGGAIPDAEAQRDAARALLTLGPEAVLLKGGHLPGDEIVDVLATPDGMQSFTTPRIKTRNTHGTGCTLASAIAAGLAQGMDLTDAVERARAYVLAAIRGAPGYGTGHGPLNHLAVVRA